MKRKLLILIFFLIVLCLGGWFAAQKISAYRANEAERAAKKAKNEEIEKVINDHRGAKISGEKKDIFGDDDLVKILLIGLDTRTGQASGHCDAIQLIAIDRKKQEIAITAVPRGTYSPLPKGKGATSSDYYISNACGLGGLDYGIKQIEKILGQKEDYLVVVGFSETLGILRNLKLPAAETMQWLRHRQGYAIGEPQRARNHSTFIKQMIVKFFAEKNSAFDSAWQYVVYKIAKTDLSFAETQILADELAKFDLAAHPERIKLAMRPAYAVQDIPYVPEEVSEYLDSMLGSLKGRLTEKEYAGISEEEAQNKFLKLIGEKKSDPEFISWAFENNIWLQIDNDENRLLAQYDFLERYLPLASSTAKRQEVIADYILEMEQRGENFWLEKGKQLLTDELEKK